MYTIKRNHANMTNSIKNKRNEIRKDDLEKLLKEQNEILVALAPLNKRSIIIGCTKPKSIYPLLCHTDERSD